jgi:hypothetical protein
MVFVLTANLSWGSRIMVLQPRNYVGSPVSRNDG